MQNLLYERIQIEHGQPVIGQRKLPVDTVIDMLASGASFEEILELNASLDRSDIMACIEFAYAK